MNDVRSLAMQGILRFASYFLYSINIFYHLSSSVSAAVKPVQDRQASARA